MLFEWDENKEKANIIKHGIDFETASRVFDDELRYEEYDYLHSINEDRLITIGEVNGKLMLLFVSFTERGDAIRIISARKANKADRRKYYDHQKRNRF
ncbi:MAG: BrnT family toxin [Oscillospiraceae bacterium]|nr:BrnT family toxin [Oscillospiraceae bacterium]